MRKRATLLITLTFYCILSWGQNSYTPLLKEGAKWKVFSQYCDPFYGCDPGMGLNLVFVYDTTYYRLGGDTIIDAVSYKKLYQSDYSYESAACGCPIPGFTPGPARCTAEYVTGFIYEDTFARRVYYKPATSSCSIDSFLFANFSLQQGDSIRFPYTTTGNFTNCDTSAFVVDSIGYSVVFNDTVRTWYLKNTDQHLQYVQPDVSLYEGIGYSFGFSLIYYLGDGAGYADRLADYCTDSVCWNPCRVTGIQDIAPDEGTVIVSPNPSSDFIRVYSTESALVQIMVTDMNGKTLMQSTSMEMNISALPSAIYYLSIFTKDGVVKRRFIKI